jgi:hypothetical protein
MTGAPNDCAGGVVDVSMESNSMDKKLVTCGLGGRKGADEGGTRGGKGAPTEGGPTGNGGDG